MRQWHDRDRQCTARGQFAPAIRRGPLGNAQTEPIIPRFMKVVGKVQFNNRDQVY